MDYTALHTELTADPAAVGYAMFIAAGNDNALAGMLNATTGPGAATISLPSLTHDEFAMPIVSSQLQADGRSYVTERHTDQNGKTYDAAGFYKAA